MLPQGARATCYPGARVSHVTPGKAKESKAEASKATQLRSKANQTVTPRVAHVTPGRACHMLPWGARVTCYPGQIKAKQSKADASKAEPSKAKQIKAASNDDDDDEDLTETHTWTCPSLRPIPLNGTTLFSTSLLNVRCARVTCYPGASKAKPSFANQMS